MQVEALAQHPRVVGQQEVVQDQVQGNTATLDQVLEERVRYRLLWTGGEQSMEETYVIPLYHLCIPEHHSVPEQPEEVVGGKGGKQVHVQRDSGTF